MRDRVRSLQGKPLSSVTTLKEDPMSRVAQHFLSDRVSRIARARWPWRATAIAAMLVAGFSIHETSIRAPLAAHAPAFPSQAPASPQQQQSLPEAAEPYASDHLDAHFIDFAHPEPLTPESVREMALTQFLGLPSAETEKHASR